MSNDNKKSYSKHSETILALVTHLAMTQHKSRTPKILAEDLALDYSEVVYVLKTFKGLFRESKGKSKYDENYYWLQLRYARWWLEGDDFPRTAKPKEPLESDYLNTLLTYITNMIEQEQTSLRQESRNRSGVYVAWLAASISLITVFANLIIYFIVR